MSSQGDREKQSALATPDTVLLTTEERIEFIAQLIVDRIVEDETSGFELLNAIKAVYGNPKVS